MEMAYQHNTWIEIYTKTPVEKEGRKEGSRRRGVEGGKGRMWEEGRKGRESKEEIQCRRADGRRENLYLCKYT
jgi:hypothetical protein